MRDTFVKTLLRLAHQREEVTLVTGDLGFGVLDGYARELPRQYINAGVAEQNMTGLAAGMALEGHTVFTYSIANFPTLRCLEQIRNDVLYHGAPVNVVAIGGGFSYGALGMSHHATEDVAILRALAGLRVYAPCDEHETVAITEHLVAQPGPSYLRLDKSKAAAVDAPAFQHGRLRPLQRGADVALLAYGGIMVEVLAAARTLAAEGLSCSVISAHTLKPFDSAGLADLARSHRLLVTVEEHNQIGGLGTLVAETMVDTGALRPLLRLALPDAYSSIVGSQEYLRQRHGLDATAIAARVRTAARELAT
ncbi:transketolase, alpha subunit [Burkholderiales bacterium JOSHI_001]|nr:transketolase, alpha subunit [Burkholderiales bacterium JOSHI_001]